MTLVSDANISMNAHSVRTFLTRAQSDTRFAKLKMLSREGNILVVTGEMDSHVDYEAFIELGRRCGFIVLCDALSINEPCSISKLPIAAEKVTGSAARDPMGIFHLLPPPPEEDHLGGYEYHCGDCITSFFNEAGHSHIQRHGAWCADCGGELILIWQPGDPIEH